MSLTQKRLLIVAGLIVLGIVLGRLGFHVFLDFMLGGTLFGGAIFYEQRAEENQEKRTCLWVFIYILAFIVAFIGGIASKSIPPSWMKDYSVKCSDKVGTVHKGETFDLYTPAKKRENLRAGCVLARWRLYNR